MGSEKEAEQTEEIQKKAIEEYGEEVGLIYMVGYMQGRLDGFNNAVKQHEDFDPSDIFISKQRRDK